MSEQGDEAIKISELTTGSLRNVIYGLSLRLAGIERRGGNSAKVKARLDAARAELAKRGEL